MSTHHYCDLCLQPIKAGVPCQTSVRAIHDTPFEHYRVPGPLQPLRTKPQAVRLTLCLCIVGHPTGFQGPPEVCEPCVIKLLQDLLAARQAAQATQQASNSQPSSVPQ